MPVPPMRDPLDPAMSLTMWKNQPIAPKAIFFLEVLADACPMRLGHWHDMQRSRLVGPHNQASELREYREEQSADTEMVREVAQVVLQPSAEVVRVAVGSEWTVLLQSLDGVVEVVPGVSLHAGYFHHDLFYLVFAPLACTIEGELARVEDVDEACEYAAADGDDAVELVGFVYMWLPLDVVLKRFSRASEDFAGIRRASKGTGPGYEELRLLLEGNLVLDERAVVIRVESCCDCVVHTSCASL